MNVLYGIFLLLFYFAIAYSIDRVQKNKLAKNQDKQKIATLESTLSDLEKDKSNLINERDSPPISVINKYIFEKHGFPSLWYLISKHVSYIDKINFKKGIYNIFNGKSLNETDTLHYKIINDLGYFWDSSGFYKIKLPFGLIEPLYITNEIEKDVLQNCSKWKNEIYEYGLGTEPWDEAALGYNSIIDNYSFDQWITYEKMLRQSREFKLILGTFYYYAINKSTHYYSVDQEKCLTRFFYSFMGDYTRHDQMIFLRYRKDKIEENFFNK